MNFFLSYSHKDSDKRNELKNNLNPHILRGRINFWYDEHLLAGDSVTPEISKQMNNANVFLLLLSRNFMSSDYILNYELKEAAKKFKEKRCRVIPIVLEDMSLKFLEEEFGELINPLPQTNEKVLKPLNKWKKSEVDTAWKIILTELEKIIFSESSVSQVANTQSEKMNTANVAGGEARSHVTAYNNDTSPEVLKTAFQHKNVVSIDILSTAANTQNDEAKVDDGDILNMITDYVFKNPDILLDILKQRKQNNGK